MEPLLWLIIAVVLIAVGFLVQEQNSRGGPWIGLII